MKGSRYADDGGERNNTMSKTYKVPKGKGVSCKPNASYLESTILIQKPNE